MRSTAIVAALAALAILTACQYAPAAPIATPASSGPAPVGLAPARPTQQATVVRVTDGDTIVVEINGTRFDVRYIGIDAPEREGPFTEAEPFGEEAAQANALLVGSQTVHLERDVSDTDRFDRLLRYVWLQAGDGWVMANRELVALGLAESRAYRPDTSWQAVLDDAEAEARRNGRGMWGSAR